MNSHKLRNIERVVLARLEEDSRCSFSKIGKSTRKSQQIVSYTVNSMIQKEMINGFFTLIDYSKLDVLNFRVHLRVNYAGGKRFDEMIKYLVKHNQTAWVASRGGRNDVVCTFFATNPSHFNKTWKAIIGKFQSQIQDYTVLTSIVNLYFGRKYLSRTKKRPIGLVVGGDREPKDVDELDLKILKEISQDGRKSSLSIAENTNSAPKTVIERMKKLRKKKIILGHRPLIDSRKTDFTPYLIFIKYHNVSPATEKRFISYLKLHPNIIRVVKTIGRWDIEMRAEVNDPLDVRTLEMELRERFATLVKEISSVPIYNVYKKTYFPDFMISNK